MNPTYFVVYGNRETEWVLGSFTDAAEAFDFFRIINRQPGEWKSIRTRFINSDPWKSDQATSG